MIGAGLSDVAFLGNRIFMKLEDGFNRADQQGLGNTPVAERPWQSISGSWSISNNRAVAANTNDPIAVVEAYTPDVDISLDVSSTGYDGIVFRLTDANNYYRLVNYYNTSSWPTYATQYEWQFMWGNYSGAAGYWHAHIHQRAWSDSRTSLDISKSHSHDVWRVATTPDDGSSISVPAGWHTHTPAWERPTGETRIYQTGTRTTISRRVQLQKIENGQRSNLYIYSVPTTSKLRVVTNGDTIQVYSNNALIYTTTNTFNLQASKHGITRGTSVGGRSGSALDNFSLTPTILL